MTFSLIGIDLQTKQIGGVIASRWTAVGACVPFYRPGLGLIHVQNHANPALAEAVFEKMEEGGTLDACLEDALKGDRLAAQRQCLIGTLDGQSHAFSGQDCTGIFDHRLGTHCAAAGNTLVCQAVVSAMVEDFDRQEGPLAERLLSAIEAGQAKGGDARGQEAAALHVYDFAYPEQQDHRLNIRVDHHEAPLTALRQTYEAWCAADRTIVR